LTLQRTWQHPRKCCNEMMAAKVKQHKTGQTSHYLLYEGNV